MNTNPGEIILPRVAHWPPYVTSAGSEVIDLMAKLNRPLDGWQAWIIERGLGQNRDVETGDLMMAADTCGCWVSRQNGKGDIIMGLEVGWLFLFGIPLVVHTAHQYRTAKEAFIRLKTLVEENEDILGKAIHAVWSAAGSHGIELTKLYKGARLSFLARAGKAGLGFSAPKVIMDEAQELNLDLMQTILPIMSAQFDPQVWYFGTPPRTDAAWIYRIKKRGEGKRPNTAWFDYGLPYIDPSTPQFTAAILSPDNHRACNPSMGVRRPNGTGLRKAAIDSELETLGVSFAFAQERCGMWLPPAIDQGDHCIAPTVWRKRKVEPPELPKDIAISFGVNMRRTHGTIMWAGKINGRWRVGIADHRPGTEWMLNRLAEIKAKYDPVVFTVDARSEQQVEELKKIEIVLPESRTYLEKAKERPKRGDLILPTAGDVATAFGMIVDAANNDEIGHHDEAPLNSAVSVNPRAVGMTGATFDHKNPAGVEVGPATNAALAMWAYRERIDKIEPYDPLGNIW